MLRLAIGEHLLFNAAVLARLSRFAYLELPLISQTLARQWPHVATFSEESAQGFCCWNDQVLVLSIRGTSALDDMLHNMRVRYATLAGYQVHSGFLAHARQVRRAVELLNLPAGLPTVFTGHSLGGAVATLLGIKPPLNVGPSHIVTFGAPRCLSPESSGRYVHPPVYRFVRCCDPVPDLPYRRVGFDYAHTGAPLVLRGIGRVEGESCAAWHRWWRRLRYFYHMHRGTLPHAISADHGIQSYECYLAPFAKDFLGRSE